MKILSMLVAVLGLSQGAWAEDFIVVGGNAPGFTQGQSLAASTRIHLDKGEQLQLKPKGGDKVFTFTGPYNDVSGSNGSEESKAILATLASILGIHRTRGDSPSATAQNLQYLDLDSQKLNHFCYRESAPPIFWRAKATFKTSLSLRREGQDEVEVEWPGKHTTLAWPQEVGLVDGGVYRIGVGGSTRKKLTLHREPVTEFSSETYRAQWMLEQGCYLQSLLVLQGIPLQ